MDNKEALGSQVYDITNSTLKGNSRLLPTIRMLQDRSDFETRCFYIGNAMLDASIELGYAFIDKLDTDIVGLFASLTGGTVGTAGNPLTWAHIINANAILSLQEFEGEVFCVLHPNQWWAFVISASREGYVATNMVGESRYKISPKAHYKPNPLSHVTFIITSAIAIDGDGNALGAMYVSSAICVDIRRHLTIETHRDEIRFGTELNASMWYDVGVINPLLGIKIIADVIQPA